MARVNEGAHSSLPAIHTFIHKWNEPYIPVFTPQPQSITALWLVLIFRSVLTGRVYGCRSTLPVNTAPVITGSVYRA